MKRILFLLIALSLIFCIGQGVKVASAHGGSYRGPAGEVPPGQRDPTDPQPPPENPPGPTTGPDNGPPSTPPGGPGSGDGGGSDSSKPKPPQRTGPLGPGIGGGPATRGGRPVQKKAMSFESWLFWWNYNKDEYLNLKAALKAGERMISTEASETFFGKAGGRNRNDAKAPTVVMIQENIVPALLSIIADKNIHPDIRGGAIIALARCGKTPQHVKMFFDAAKANSGEDRLVQESAILALGILQLKTTEISSFLIDLADNMKVPFRARSFALVSLGLLQDSSDEAFACLQRRLDGREASLDVPISALLAMGLIGDNKRVPILTKWLVEGRIGRSRLGDLEKSYIVGALGKIGDPAALKTVEATLRRKDSATRRTAMIAFGQLVPQAKPKAQMEHLKRLVSFLAAEKDKTTRNFGIMSLGRIGGQADAPEAVRDAAVTVLTQRFENGDRYSERPFAALALGLICFEGDENTRKSRDLTYKLSGIVRSELAKLKGDRISLGALAISLGLMGDRNQKTLDLLTGILADRGLGKELRGSAAIALGLIGDNSSKTAIIKALRERQDRDLRIDTAVAAGLIGDSSAVKELVAVVNDPKASQFVLGSVAMALGQIGDAKAIEPMLRILEPGKTNGAFPDMTRALVAVSLGQLAYREDMRVLFKISKNINYRANVSALTELLSIL